MSAAGTTRKLDPNAMQRSAKLAFLNPFCNSSLGKFSPKLTIVSSSSQLQFLSSHLLPVI